MDYWQQPYELNELPLALADLKRVNGVVNFDGDFIPISLNPAYLHLSAYFLARAEKAKLLCELARVLIDRNRALPEASEARLRLLNEWLKHGYRTGDRCFATNSLTIRTRKGPMKVSLGTINKYLSSLLDTSMPYRPNDQFKFFFGKFQNRLSLLTTIDLHYLKFSLCSGVVHKSLPYPHIDYLCEDSMCGNQNFLRSVE